MSAKPFDIASKRGAFVELVRSALLDNLGHNPENGV
jgi:hypothetical protein